MPTLIFRIDIDSPDDYMKQWNEFKVECIHQNQDIIDEIKGNCKLDDNDILDNLDKLEDSCNYVGDDYSYLRINDIILKEVISTDSDSDKWTYAEMDDLIEGFLITANNHVKGKCVNGYIKG